MKYNKNGSITIKCKKYKVCSTSSDITIMSCPGINIGPILCDGKGRIELTWIQYILYKHLLEN